MISKQYASSYDETKKMAQDSQIVRAEENLKLSHGESSYRESWAKYSLVEMCNTL